MRITRRRAAALILAAPTPGLLSGPARADEAVDAAIVLAADVSRSIDDEEFTLQRQGYAAAITSPRVMEAVRSGPRAAIALAFLEWAGEAEQRVVVEWATIKAEADASPRKQGLQTYATALVDGFEEELRASPIEVEIRKVEPPKKEAPKKK